MFKIDGGIFIKTESETHIKMPLIISLLLHTHTYSLSNRGGAILIASGPGHMGKQSYRAWNPALSHGSSYREELKNQGMRLLSFDKHMYNVLSHFFFHFYTKTL